MAPDDISRIMGKLDIVHEQGIRNETLLQSVQSDVVTVKARLDDPDHAACTKGILLERWVKDHDKIRHPVIVPAPKPTQPPTQKGFGIKAFGVELTNLGIRHVFYAVMVAGIVYLVAAKHGLIP